MHATAAGPADWRWAAVDGSSKGIADDAPPLYVQDPGAWWDGLRELMRSGNKAHSTRAAQIYSSTKAFMDIYGIEPWAHHHYPEDAPGGTGSGRRCPDCCERPMHAQPRGWACRVTGRTVPYARRES
jgi:hypothetical protein